VKLVHLIGFITKKFITMHGHMNVELLVPEHPHLNFTHTYYDQSNLLVITQIL